jgi:hypothetical protein
MTTSGVIVVVIIVMDTRVPTHTKRGGIKSMAALFLLIAA